MSNLLLPSSQLETNIVDGMALKAPLAPIRIQTSTSTETTLIEPIQCSCVDFAREQGLDFPRIRTPNDLIPNSIPCIGCAVLISYSLPHMGVIADLSHGGIIYKDRRLLNGECIETMRFLEFTDERLRGFYK